MEHRGRIPPRQGAQSIEHVLGVLEVVADRADGAEPGYVAEQLGLTASTTYRMMRALSDHGYLRRTPDSGRYVLGPTVAELGYAQQRQLTATPRVKSFLKRLHDEQGGSTYLAVMHHDDVLLVHIHESLEHPRVGDLHIGYVRNTERTSFGKLLRRNRSTEELAMRALPRDLDQGQLSELRRRIVTNDEIVYEVEEFEPGAACLAAPVRDRRGVTIGAVSLAVTPDAIEARSGELERALRRTALLVAAQLAP